MTVRKLSIAALVIGISAALTAPSLGASPAPTPNALKGASAQRAMALANTWGLAKENVTSFVTPLGVSFKFADGASVTVPMPKERMVVAVAPWLTFTHPCSTHYMSSCRAEFPNTSFKVTAKSLTSGKVLLAGTVKTGGSGFAELWLPRGHRISLTVEGEGKQAVGEISTLADSNTCVTTFQLK